MLFIIAPSRNVAQLKPETKAPLDTKSPQSELKIDQQVNASIDRGLAYIVSKQKKDGGWHSNNAHNALAMLAMMGRGHTPGRGRYPDVLENGKKFLLANAQDNPKGYLAQLGGGSMYEHGLCTLALAEMYGMDADPELEARLRAAVSLIERTQSPKGGWRYSPAPDNQDLSVTVMQIVALRAANNAEIPVSQAVIDKAIAYVKSCSYPAGGFGYEGPAQDGPTSAAGVLSLQLLGKPDDPGIPKTMGYLKTFLRNTPKEQWDTHGLSYFFYFHYYAMQAHYQYGGVMWNDWHPKVRDALLMKQNTDGSWDIPSGSSEAAHGDPNKVYSTAMACLVLDIYLHFLPAYQR
jgi:Prenyltransferase and squalene oxidase repeat